MKTGQLEQIREMIYNEYVSLHGNDGNEDIFTASIIEKIKEII